MTHQNTGRAPDSFQAMGLHTQLLSNLRKLAHARPTPVQDMALPVLLQRRDALVCAPTGSGKTAAYVLPLLQHLPKIMQRERQGRCHALILVPTRELAAQVAHCLRDYGTGLRFRILQAVGGAPLAPQCKQAREGAEIVVATPGRLLELCHREVLALDKTRYIVVDEADQLLALGFIGALRRVLHQLPAQRQLSMFSATLPEAISGLARSFCRNPVMLRSEDSQRMPDSLVQQLIWVDRQSKMQVLREQILACAGQVLVFVRDRAHCLRLSERIAAYQPAVDFLHGERTQAERNEVLHRLRVGVCRVLVATDLAARGLDVRGIACVINFDLPDTAESYIHRVGRAGRQGDAGLAVTLCDGRDVAHWRALEQTLELRLTAQDRRGASDGGRAQDKAPAGAARSDGYAPPKRRLSGRGRRGAS